MQRISKIRSYWKKSLNLTAKMIRIFYCKIYVNRITALKKVFFRHSICVFRELLEKIAEGNDVMMECSTLAVDKKVK